MNLKIKENKDKTINVIYEVNINNWDELGNMMKMLNGIFGD